MQQNIQFAPISINQIQQQSPTQHSSQFISTIFICYSYFIQGAILSIPTTIILTYDNIPQYSVLSIFAISTLPFSFKFIFAPFMETFTSIQYGKRKTWLIVAFLAISGSIFIMSYLTAQKYQIYFALVCFNLYFFTALQDITLNVLSVKQLKNPEKTSFIQVSVWKMGTIVGSLLMIKLTSQRFGKLIGKTGSIWTVQQLLIYLSVFIFIVNLFIHFLFKQQTLQDERLLKQKNLKDNIVEYRIFFQYKSKYFRQAIMFFIYNQGMKFFQSGYWIQLMKNGFSKETFNQINNLGAIPIVILTFFFSKTISDQNIHNYFMYIQAIKTFFFIFYFIMQFDSNFSVWIYVTLTELLNNFQILVISAIVNFYPVSGLSGMFITMFFSCYHLGQMQTIHLLIIGEIGFKNAALIGFIIQLVILYNFSDLIKWVNQGDLLVKVQILSTQTQLNQLDQSNRDI